MEAVVVGLVVLGAVVVVIGVETLKTHGLETQGRMLSLSRSFSCFVCVTLLREAPVYFLSMFRVTLFVT